MSDLSVTGHNLAALMSGKIDFSDFLSGEAKLFEENIASLPEAAQGAATLALDSLKAGASSLVGVGLTAIGPILSESSDTQATQVLNLLQQIGVPTNGILTLAEHAALTTVINGLKAGLDKIGLQIGTTGQVTVVAGGGAGIGGGVTGAAVSGGAFVGG
jgi:hypothetical protein